MLMTNQQSAELPEPGIGSFHDPSPFVASQFAAIFVSPPFVVLPVRRDQFDASLLQSLAQRIGVVTAVGDHALWLLPRPAFRPGDADFCERGLRKRNFCSERHFPAELPAEDLYRRPVPSTSCPCHAWFCRLRRPLFRRSEAAVQEGLVPLQQTSLVQCAQQRSPGIQPDALLLPLLQSPPAGRRRGKLVGQKPPRRPGLQNPQNALETGSIRSPWPASVVLPAPSAPETTAQSTPTAHRSTASAASS